MPLVEVKEDVVYCDSSMIARKFGVKHAYVIRNCDSLIKDIIKIKGDPKSPLIIKEEREYRGARFTAYLMDRNFFSLLCMRFKGVKALEWQMKFNDAFYAMEKALLLKSNDIEWKQARIQSKGARKSVTDQIAEFVKYATAQGSKSASMYYSNITKMEYKALELINKNEKVQKGFRDTLDAMDLSFLTTAEYVARKALQEGMNQKLHYKEIYIYAKQAVFNYAETVTVLKLTNKG